MPSLPPIFRSLSTTSVVALVELLDRGVAVGRFVHVVPGLGQRAEEAAPERVVIVSDENATHICPQWPN